MSPKTFSQKATEVAADRVKITFGPEVTKALNNLGDSVQGNPNFDSDTLALLQSLTSGEPVELPSAMTRLAMVVRDATACAEKANDARIESALTEVIADLMGQSRNAKPLRVTVDPRSRSRLEE